MMRGTISFLLLFSNIIFVHGTTNTKHYIVYMGEHSHPTPDSIVSANHAMLASITGNDTKAKQAAKHHYCRTFRGFSAVLTPEQARQLEESEDVISVFESKMYKLQSTHSWEFLGVQTQSKLGEALHLGSDVIIASIDTGIWPESESFNDEGLGPVPSRFKGECVPGQNFTESNCNRKIIGARFFSKGMEAHGPLENYGLPFFRSARDADGHGTHTASTVAGALVPNTSVDGMAAGTARGGGPGARIAVYKACWFNLCNDADLLSAFDEAVADGVDIISISTGARQQQRSYFLDSVAIGSFHAFKNGILVSAAGGNFGGTATVGNIAPWILTVAASSVDRRFEALVRLGNNQVLRGTSLNPWGLDVPYGIVSGKANASYCYNNTLNHELVAGKIVVCALEPGKADKKTDKAIFVKVAGGVGMILVDPVGVERARTYVIPTSVIGANEASVLYEYLASDRNPVASISETKTVLGSRGAPEVAVFSSRGPNTITPDIIKPDITAPGLNILAAWAPVAIDDTAGRPLSYFIVSGTSMACPHVSAAAAIVKSLHPSWSPSIIMSALMTTATVEDNVKNPIGRYLNGTHVIQATPFDFGSGHLNPMAAVDPGLVYGFGSGDIMDFLCSNGASPAGIKNLTGMAIICKTPPVAPYDLNYPSIGVANLTGVASVPRTVTSVSEGHRVYDVIIESPKGVLVRVVPNRLEFSGAGENKSFTVDLVAQETSQKRFVFGSITWSDGFHKVRSPIAIKVFSL